MNCELHRFPWRHRNEHFFLSTRLHTQIIEGIVGIVTGVSDQCHGVQHQGSRQRIPGITPQTNLHMTDICRNLKEAAVGSAGFDLQPVSTTMLQMSPGFLTSHDSYGNPDQGACPGRSGELGVNFRIKRLTRAGHGNIKYGTYRNTSIGKTGIPRDFHPWLGCRKNQIIFKVEFLGRGHLRRKLRRKVKADLPFTHRNVSAEIQPGARTKGIPLGLNVVEMIPGGLLLIGLQVSPRRECLHEPGTLGKHFNPLDEARAIHERGTNPSR